MHVNVGYLWADYFGRRHLGSIQGDGARPASSWGLSLGPLPFSLSLDLTGGLLRRSPRAPRPSACWSPSPPPYCSAIQGGPHRSPDSRPGRPDPLGSVSGNSIERPGNCADPDFDTLGPPAPRQPRQPRPCGSPPHHQAFLEGRGVACRPPLGTYNCGMNTDRRDKELQVRASELVNRISLLRDEDKLPLIVEFAGSPKAGKSTTIDIVTHFFKRTGFKTWAPTEGASKTYSVFLAPRLGRVQRMGTELCDKRDIDRLPQRRGIRSCRPLTEGRSTRLPG